ncbi:MAG: DNA polymerase I [Candidatus Margulisiibacteriota bacterium]
MAAKKVVLIDGNSLTYRAFYALPDTMRTTSGITTNAIYGFTTMILKVLEEKPEYIAISFDLKEPTFRHKEYKEYKATRQKAPPTLHEQMPYVKEIAAGLNIPIYEFAGFEADDVIGTLATLSAERGCDVVIVTGDSDPMQLVDDRIKVLINKKGISDTMLYGMKEVRERYGIEPKQLIDYKGLKGDSSDNIPGVPKIGEKTAVELLKEYGSLENIYNNLDKIKKPALHETLKNNRMLADLSKRLGTIVTDVPLKFDLEDLKRTEINWEKAIKLFEKFEFESLVKKYAKNNKNSEDMIIKKREEIAKLDFKTVLSESELQNLFDELSSADEFAFDTETTSLNPYEAEIVGISFSTKKESAYYIPLKHRSSTPQLPFNLVFERLKPIFLSDKLKIGQNIKYDLEILKCSGIEVKGPYFDTMVAAYILDPIAGKYSLKHLAKQFLGKDMIKYLEIAGDEVEHKDFSHVPIDLATDYAGSDADSTFCLYEIFKLALKARKMEDLFYRVEMPLIEVLVEMETNGVNIATDKLAVMSQELEIELKELERHIFSIAGEVFNINSPKQMANILFNKLMLPVIKKTKTGASTDAEVLTELAARKFEIAEKLLEYRQLNKLKNTYIDVLPTLVNPKTGRIHASFNQTITATGRLSSSNPNLQNIPAKGKWGKRIRAAFIPDKKDWLFIAADYSQIELRVLAHLSQDEVLLTAFREDKDVHQITADELGISRDAAKTVNFGVIYGISDFGLAKQLGIKRTEASIYIEKYFNKHKGVKAFIDKTIADAKEKGYVETLLGRKRPTPDINNPNQGIRSAAERMAINTPVQGSAADMIKVAMVNINNKLQASSYKAKLILQVHDELIFETPQGEADAVKKIVDEEMEKALPLSIPVKVDIGVGPSWSEAI